MSRSAAFGRIVLAYVVATAAGVGAAWAFDYDPLIRGAIADAVGTLVIFAFSVLYRNASTYDAYWSVAPMALVAYWAAVGNAPLVRVALVVGLTWWWGARLTWNWARGWTGLDHEDWRYVDLRAKTGVAYPFVNLFGIHFFPTVQVFLGLLPAHAALTSTEPLGWKDGLAAAVTAIAVLIEQIADRQLLDFRRSDRESGAVLNTGLWAWSRHPNYFGEALFWWGLALFGWAIAAEPWRWTGAITITVMFAFISIPMIEKRHRERRSDYEAKAARTSFLLWPPRSS